MSERDRERTSRVADKAYARYVNRGGADGHAAEDWLAAERDVATEDEAADTASGAAEPEPARQPRATIVAGPKARKASKE